MDLVVLIGFVAASVVFACGFLIKLFEHRRTRKKALQRQAQPYCIENRVAPLPLYIEMPIHQTFSTIANSLIRSASDRGAWTLNAYPELGILQGRLIVPNTENVYYSDRSSERVLHLNMKFVTEPDATTKVQWQFSTTIGNPANQLSSASAPTSTQEHNLIDSTNECILSAAGVLDQ